MGRLPVLDVSLFVNNVLGEGEAFVRKLANEVGKARAAGQSEAQIRESIVTDIANGRGPIGGLVATARDEVEVRQQRLYNLGQGQVLTGDAKIKMKMSGIEKETEKAVMARLRVLLTGSDIEKTQFMWFPKSQIDLTQDSISVPQWLFDSKESDLPGGIEFQVVDVEEPATEKPFVWVATGSETCPSCIGRHGKVKTWAEWVSLGLPGQGRTICKYSCRCTLIPQARAEAIYGVEGAAAIEARAEEPLKRRLKEIKDLEKVRGSDFAQSTFQAKLGDFRSIGSSATVTPRGAATLPENQKRIFQRVSELSRTGDIEEIKKWPEQDRQAVRKATEIFAARSAKRQREVDVAKAKRRKRK